MIEYTDPTPAPPLQGRGVATAGEAQPHGTPLLGQAKRPKGRAEGRGVATAVSNPHGPFLLLEGRKNGPCGVLFDICRLFQVDSVI